MTERRRSRTGGALSLACALVALGASLLGLSPILVLGPWALHAGAVLGAVALASGGTRLLGGGPFSPLLGLGAGTLVTVLLVGEQAGTSGGELFGTARALASEGVESIAAQIPPAVVTAGIEAILLTGVLVVAVLTDLIVTVARFPVLAAVGPLAVLCLPGAVAGLVPPPASAIAAGAATLCSVLSAQQAAWPMWNRLAASILPLPLAVLIAIPAASAVGSGAFSGATRLTGSANLSLVLAQGLTRDAETVAFTYTLSGADRTPYFGLSTVTDLSGSTWTADRPDATTVTLPTGSVPDGMSGSVAAALGSDAIAAASHRVRATLSGLQTNWLPAPRAVLGDDGLAANWRWGAESRTAYSDVAAKPGDSYTIDYIDMTALREDIDQLGLDVSWFEADDAGESPEGDTVSLPDDMPEVVAATATAQGRGAGTLARLESIEDYFHSGAFEYSLSAPDEEGYAGSGAQVAGQFLAAKRGYCVQFAGTMALMARSLGIPARVVVGYTGGTETAPDTYTVTSHDLHAWVEAWVTGMGWTPFDPTPGSGGDGSASAAPATASSEAASSSASSDPAESSPTASSRRSQPQDRSAEAGAQGADAPPPFAAAGWISGGAILLALLALPGAARASRRRRRLSDGRPIAVWQELIDTARDLGAPADPALTARESAVQLGERFGLGDAQLTELLAIARAAEAARFSAEPARADADLAAASGILDRFGRASGVLARARAAALPASLLGSGGRDSRRL